MNTTLEAILKDLDLPPTSSKIYRDLLEHGEATARLLSDRLKITRPSTYDHLAILRKKGLVVERKVESKTFFAVDDVRHISQSLSEKIFTLKEHEKTFATMLPELLKQGISATPTIKFFEGEAGLQHLFYDLLWSKGETVYSMWPHEEIEKHFDKEFLVRFNERRIKEKISVCALWPHSMKPKESYIWEGRDELTKRRYAKRGLLWKMGYTIYSDKVSFISSTQEVFGFIVQSKDFALLMKLQFDALWENATEK